MVAMSAWAVEELFSVPNLDYLVYDSPMSAVIWEASPVLKGVIDRVEAMRVESGLSAAGVAIDLGCGSGRDCVFLARRGWKSTGYDYLEDSLERARKLAERYGTKIETVEADLEAETFALNKTADLINVSRYLHRPLLPLIAQAVNSGGFIVYHQFMVGCTKPRRARFLLAENELAQTFIALGFDVIEDKVFNISDGRPCSWFVARKKSNNE